MKKDKVKVLDEVLNEERIKQFLEIEAPRNENTDFHRLQKAYRGMPAQYFEEFVAFFIVVGGDINAQSSQGENILQHISNHKPSKAYRNILQSAGAQ